MLKLETIKTMHTLGGKKRTITSIKKQLNKIIEIAFYSFVCNDLYTVIVNRVLKCQFFINFYHRVTWEPLDGKLGSSLILYSNSRAVQWWLKHGNLSRGTKIYHFLHEALFQALADSMHKNVHHEAHGCLRVIGLKQEESRRVALSSGLCLES